MLLKILQLIQLLLLFPPTLLWELNLLLMTCYVAIKAPNGSSVEARALLDSASSASFVSERLVQSLRLPRSHRSVHISDVAGLMCNSSTKHIADFKVSSLRSPSRKLNVSAVSPSRNVQPTISPCSSQPRVGPLGSGGLNGGKGDANEPPFGLDLLQRSTGDKLNGTSLSV